MVTELSGLEHLVFVEHLVGGMDGLISAAPQIEDLLVQVGNTSKLKHDAFASPL